MSSLGMFLKLYNMVAIMILKNKIHLFEMT